MDFTLISISDYLAALPFTNTTRIFVLLLNDDLLFIGSTVRGWAGGPFPFRSFLDFGIGVSGNGDAVVVCISTCHVLLQEGSVREPGGEVRVLSRSRVGVYSSSKWTRVKHWSA